LLILAAAVATLMMVSARMAETPLKGPQLEKASAAAKASPLQEKHVGEN
jgi:hypothetical protein